MKQTLVGSKTCIVVLTDTLYLPGTKKLIQSWDRFNEALPLIVLSLDEKVFEDEFITVRTTKRIVVDSRSYESIQTYKKRRSKRHAQTFYKFEAFADFGYDRNIFLDSDLLCLRPAPLLQNASEASLRAVLDSSFRKTRGYKGHLQEINSGVLVIEKSIQGQATIDRLKAIAQSDPGRGGYNAGDQGIINKWIHSYSISLEILPSHYNLLKKDYGDASGLEECVLLHYSAHKPWIKAENSPDIQQRAVKILQQLWFNCENRKESTDKVLS